LRLTLLVRGLVSAVVVIASAEPLGAQQSTDAHAGPAPGIERVSINDSRTAAGRLDRDTLTIHLETRSGDWHPDGDADPGVVVNAFAVEGAPLQVPGPLIRVTEGTTIRAAIRNRLAEPLFLHGFYSRPAASADPAAPFVIPPGAMREVEFVAGAPGSYFYWASSGRDVVQREAKDTQLSGALIVDARGASTSDRVLVMTVWNGRPLVDGVPVRVLRYLINGKTWPHTERLTYDVGDTVRMRVLNVGGPVHPMHLHGFYFNVDSRGNERTDTVFPPGSSPHLVNTERLPSGQTFSLTWIPTRPGNWLFHCHDIVHTERKPQLDGRPAALPPEHHAVNHALEMMAGPIIGITVRSKGVAAPSDTRERRRLHLVARVDTGGTEGEPAYGFSLEERGTETPAVPPYLPGPTVVLQRGEPVSINVENRLPEATAVHWHGIEVDSYFDGVAGFAGHDQQVAPAIPPGGTFEARFTPPRAGTFIYHSHVDEVRQLQAGLSGALIVVDARADYDPSHDFVMLVTTPRRAADDDVVLLNGASSPAPREMRVGERYRLRFINMHTSRPSMRMRLLHDGQLATWRALAKDGMDLPSEQATVGPSEVQMGNGETYDFEFVPETAGGRLFEIRSAGDALLVSMPIQVTAGAR